MIFSVSETQGPENMAKIYKIAIDGHAASGKSTSAKKIAEILEFDHINSGNVYRALAYVFMKNFGILKECYISNEQVDFLEKVKFQIVNNKYFWNGKECILRSTEIDQFVPKLASIKEVREIANIIQQDLIKSAKKGIVMDGRDIATKIMPDADLKVFMTASPQKRAERRLKEIGGGDFDHILQDIIIRDKIDETREHGALQKTDDCFFIKNNDLSFDEQVDLIVKTFNECAKK